MAPLYDANPSCMGRSITKVVLSVYVPGEIPSTPR